MQFVNHSLPISENDPFDTTSAYSVSRIQSVYTARYYRSKGLMVYIGYFFHHDSPFRSEKHLNMKIVKTALKIERGQEEILEIGNLDVVKEFNYAGDIMEAVWLLVNQSNIFEAVLGSGTGYPIKTWIEICFDMIGKDWTKYTKINTDFKAEFSSLVSDPKTLSKLGWQPLINIDKLAFKMMKESSNV